MPHKISRHQYNMLPPWPLTPFRSKAAACRLLAGEGTGADLDDFIKMCIHFGRIGTARELLLPPGSWS